MTNGTQNLDNRESGQITIGACYKLPFLSLFNEDCLETMKRIPDNSVDLMLTDPPYNTTNCEWEYAIDFEKLWAEWLRIVKPNGAFIFTASQPFTTDLINSNRKMFRYELIWEKPNPSNPLLAGKQPMKNHENIVVFYRTLPTFNPQKTIRLQENKRTQKIKEKGVFETTGQKRIIPNADGETKMPMSVLFFNREQTGYHPTQKPVDLMRYLVLTYSNKGETVFDGFSGSCTTGEACLVEGRKFIGSELEPKYFEVSKQRLSNVPTQLF